MATKPPSTAQLQAAQTQAAQAVEIEAAARKSLAEAVDTISRLKLAATAASNRELKATVEVDVPRQ